MKTLGSLASSSSRALLSAYLLVIFVAKVLLKKLVTFFSIRKKFIKFIPYQQKGMNDYVTIVKYCQLSVMVNNRLYVIYENLNIYFEFIPYLFYFTLCLPEKNNYFDWR